VTPRGAIGPLAIVWGVLLVAGYSPVGALQQEPDRFLAECSEPEEDENESRLSDECIPLADLPDRPRPIIELGEPFLGTGTLGSGFTIPGGAVWQPALMAFGTLRTAIQGSGRSDGTRLMEAVARFDLFGNLYLTQTERVLVGLRPLDQDGAFTRYTIQGSSPGLPDAAREFEDELNYDLTTLFFEGDLGEMFPSLDNDDSAGLDIYVGVGRQPLAFQEGALLNEDAMDMVGLTRANMKIAGTVNTRITGVYAWGEINRHGIAFNPEDGDAQLFGLFSEIDTRSTTVELDAAFVQSSNLTGDGIYAAIADTRRIGRFGNTFRVLASFPIGAETQFNSQGVLIQNQLSWTPHHNHNFWYVSVFGGINEFRSAARGASAGGPAGAAGLLFAAPGIGRAGAPLGNTVDKTVGGSLGHQIFSHDTRKQLLIEVGGRYGYDDIVDGSGSVRTPPTAFAGLARAQIAMRRRFVVILDAFGSYNRTTRQSSAGTRLELALAL
jgi:hypothetical protein